MAYYLRQYVGRPSPLYFAERLTQEAGGARIFLKREDLNHTGAHKINNCIGQALLTLRMGKPRVIAETGAGQHGVATATAAALFGLQCQVYMGEEDVRRQKLNVFKMRALGAEVVSVKTGSRTLRDAINEALRDWMASVDAHPLHHRQRRRTAPVSAKLCGISKSVIGTETREQCLAQTGKLPDIVVACVGGGSNAAGMFYPFVADSGVELIGVEAGGRGAEAGGACGHVDPRQAWRAPRHLQLCPAGRRRPDGRQSIPCRPGSIIPAWGQSTATGKTPGRISYTSVTDAEALEAFRPLQPAGGDPAGPGNGPCRGRREWPGGERGKDEVVVDLLLRPRRQGLLRSGPDPRGRDRMNAIDALFRSCASTTARRSCPS